MNIYDIKNNRLENVGDARFEKDGVNLKTLKKFSHTHVDNEVPTGIIDSSNDAFFTAFPYLSKSTKLYRNGIRQVLNVQYVESGGNLLELLPAPSPGETLIVDYIKL
jgi:hypothetical protein